MGITRGSYDEPHMAEGERIRRSMVVEASRAAVKRDSLANQLHEIATSVEGANGDMLAWAIQEMGRIRAEMELCRMALNYEAELAKEKVP